MNVLENGSVPKEGLEPSRPKGRRILNPIGRRTKAPRTAKTALSTRESAGTPRAFDAGFTRGVSGGAPCCSSRAQDNHSQATDRRRLAGMVSGGGR